MMYVKHIKYSRIKNGTDMICDIDSYRLPTWHHTLWNLLVSLRIKPQRMRSIYQLCINIPHWIDKAWSGNIGREGWAKKLWCLSLPLWTCFIFLPKEIALKEYMMVLEVLLKGI